MQGQTAQVAKKMALLKKEGVDFNARSVASPDFVIKGSQLSVAWSTKGQDLMQHGVQRPWRLPRWFHVKSHWAFEDIIMRFLSHVYAPHVQSRINFRLYSVACLEGFRGPLIPSNSASPCMSDLVCHSTSRPSKGMKCEGTTSLPLMTSNCWCPPSCAASPSMCNCWVSYNQGCVVIHTYLKGHNGSMWQCAWSWNGSHETRSSRRPFFQLLWHKSSILDISVNHQVSKRFASRQCVKWSSCSHFISTSDLSQRSLSAVCHTVDLHMQSVCPWLEQEDQNVHINPNPNGSSSGQFV